MENCPKLVSYLMHSQTQTHVFHLQTKSYAEHKALQKYYEGIDDLVDGLVESYQGKYGIIKDYSSFPLLSYTDKNQVVTYFEQLNQIIEQLRQDNQDSYIQNQIDTIIELIRSTLYKLKCLS